MKSQNVSPLTLPVLICTSIIPSIHIAAIAEYLCPLISGFSATARIPLKEYPNLRSVLRLSEPVSSTKMNMCGSNSEISDKNCILRSSLLCWAVSLNFVWEIPDNVRKNLQMVAVLTLVPVDCTSLHMMEIHRWVLYYHPHHSHLIKPTPLPLCECAYMWPVGSSFPAGSTNPFPWLWFQHRVAHTRCMQISTHVTLLLHVHILTLLHTHAGLHTAWTSVVDHPSSHTVPHLWLWHNSTRPS